MDDYMDMKTTIIMDILLIGWLKSLKILSAFQNFKLKIQFPVCFMWVRSTINWTFRLMKVSKRLHQLSPLRFNALWQAHAWRSRLRHSATRRRVTGSIPDWVMGIFLWLNPSGRNMAVGSTQPLTEMITKNISWGVKTAVAYGLPNLPPSCTDCLEILGAASS